MMEVTKSLIMAFGNPHAKAVVSLGGVATYTGGLSAFLAEGTNIKSQIASKILGAVSVFGLVDSQALSMEAVTYKQDSLIVDTITTTYMKNPILEFGYD